MNLMNNRKKEHDSTLIMMVGISGSGKSTKAQELSQLYNAKIYSSDELRQELYGDVNNQEHNQELFMELHKRMVNDLKNNKSVIYDATNLSLKNRRTFFTYMEDHQCFPIHIYAYVMSTSFENCIKQNQMRERHVPEEVLGKQMRSFEIPFYEEGFDEIFIDKWCEPTNIFKYNFMDRKQNLQYKISILKDMVGVDQSCKYHKYTLDIHSRLCGNYINCPDNGWLRILKEAADFHDVGKLFTRTQKENGECSYLNHANVGTYYLLSQLNALDLSNWESIIYCLTIINYHMRPFDWKTEKIQNKYFKIFGPTLYTYLTYFNICDKKACGIEEGDENNE